MVAVAGTLDAPRVLERRRVVIADPELAGSKQPYHAAAELPLAQAESVVRRAIDSSRALALEALGATLKKMRAAGREVSACGILLGSGKPLPALDRILASHAMIHTAEGVLFRDVLAWAAQASRLAVTGVPEKDLDPASLERIATLGKRIGPPWTQDQKFATLAALRALDRP